MPQASQPSIKNRERKERSAVTCRVGARARFAAEKRGTTCESCDDVALSWQESSLLSARRCRLAARAAIVLSTITRSTTMQQKQVQ